MMCRFRQRLFAPLLACAILQGCSLDAGSPTPYPVPGPVSGSLPADAAVLPSPVPESAIRNGRILAPGGEGSARPEHPEIYPGAELPSEERMTPRLGAGAEVALAGDAVTLNFVNTDVREVARAVLGDLLGLNFVVDPQAQGTVTVQTSRPIDRADVLPTLEVIFRASGFTLSEVQGVFRIRPLRGAQAGEAGAVARALGAGGGVHVASLRFASAVELQTLLDPVVPPGVVLHADRTRNRLLIAGPRDELSAIVDLVDSFDVDWLAGTSYALYPLQSGVAGNLVGDLERIFGNMEQGPADGVVRFLPIERMNAVLVIANSSEYLDYARQWIARLDRGGDENRPGLHVYYVQNSRAADLAAVLAQLFPAQSVSSVLPLTSPALVQSELNSGDAAPAGAAEASGLGADDDSTFPSSGGPGRSGGQDSATGPGPTRAASGPTVPLPGLDAFGRGTERGTGRGTGRDRQIRVVADEKNNALVIYALPRDYRMMEAAIRRLDIVPQQVMIEATIVEVTLTDMLRYGLQWFFESGDFSAVLTRSSSSAIASVNPGFNFTYAGGDARAILSALNEVTDVNVVSSPQVVVLDHQTAILQVGDQVPVPVQQAQSVTDPDAPIVNAIEYRDTGVILRVTPRVNATGQIILDIVQEVSDVTNTTTSDIDAPTISQRRIVSSVSVQNGETVALGGLIRDGSTRGRSGIPVLSEIPVLGVLFGERRVEQSRTELLVLLTPRTIRNPAEAREITEEMRRRLTTIRDRWPL